jgi:ATP-dependent Clp protease ATP-binding subunit ClpC
VFERYTEPARQVVVYASEEARELRHDAIGTEHVLIGLLREDRGLAARVLDSLGVTLSEVRGQVARIVGTGPEARTGEMPFTARTKKVLQLAVHEATSLGHDQVGTEHILLALAREGSGVAAQLLTDAGAAPARVIAAVDAAWSGE